MRENEATRALKSQARMKKICARVSTILKVIFVLLCIYWICVACLFIYSLVSPNLHSSTNQNDSIQLGFYLVFGLIVGTIFILLIRIFSDAIRGEAPFTMAQVKRLRLIALMLVIYAIVDTFVTASNLVYQSGGFESGFAITNQNTVFAMNFGPIVTAAAIFAFSFVFKYGVLLQEFSDETL